MAEGEVDGNVDRVLEFEQLMGTPDTSAHVRNIHNIHADMYMTSMEITHVIQCTEAEIDLHVPPPPQSLRQQIWQHPYVNICFDFNKGTCQRPSCNVPYHGRDMFPRLSNIRNTPFRNGGPRDFNRGRGRHLGFQQQHITIDRCSQMEQNTQQHISTVSFPLAKSPINIRKS